MVTGRDSYPRAILAPLINLSFSCSEKSVGRTSKCVESMGPDCLLLGRDFGELAAALSFKSMSGAGMPFQHFPSGSSHVHLCRVSIFTVPSWNLL